MHRVESVLTDDGAEIAIHRTGGGGAPAVLLHGFTLAHSIWGDVVERVPADRHLVAPDLRGHGASTLGTATPDLDRLTADLADVLDALDLVDATVVGHSLGAFVALRARTLDRVGRVVAVSGMETSVTRPVQRLGARLFGSGLGGRLVASPRVGRPMLRPWFGPAADNAQIERVRRLSAACPVATRRAIAAATGDIDLRPGLATPGVPTVVVCGEEDAATPPDHSRRIAAAVEGAELRLIPGAGHMVIVERPGDLAALIAT